MKKETGVISEKGMRREKKYKRLEMSQNKKMAQPQGGEAGLDRSGNIDFEGKCKKR